MTRRGGKWGSEVRDIPSPVLEPTFTPPRETKIKPGPVIYEPHQGAVRTLRVYTGVKLLGIATMHKSNAVPVFSEEEAVELAKMRRG